jgi:hypothetical protein
MAGMSLYLCTASISAQGPSTSTLVLLAAISLVQGFALFLLMRGRAAISSNDAGRTAKVLVATLLVTTSSALVALFVSGQFALELDASVSSVLLLLSAVMSFVVLVGAFIVSDQRC